ncbi:MAG: TonB-dependent receptor plug domain-containing protein [Rhodothermaceae bacterium]
MQKKGLIILLLFLFPVLVFGQGMKIKGKLVDTNGEPLIGANVMVPSLSVGAASNFDGDYQFDISSADVNGQEVVVKASYIGYKSKTAKVVLKGGTLTLNFTLEEDIFKSEEVVVTGIASRTSKAVSEVAVARIDAKELASKQNYQSVSQLFSGKISGVNVRTSSGNVGSGWRFHMRGGGGLNGSGQPLIFVDGIKIDNVEYEGYGSGGQSTSILANLNVDDIENVEILKGPAASAMYGTNASNGVVIITTKSGSISANGTFDVNYRFNYGINELGKKYDETKYKRAKDFHKLLETNGVIREHTVSISGGNNSIQYYTSLQNRFESGLIPHQNNMDRTTAKLNLTVYPTEELTIKATTSYIRNKIERPTNDNQIYGWMLNALVYEKYRADSAAIAATSNSFDNNQFLGGLNITYKPMQDLEINAEAGLDYADIRNIRHQPYGYKYGSLTTGEIALWHRMAWTTSMNMSARYNYELIEGLKGSSVAGFQANEKKTNFEQMRVRGFANPFITDIGAGESVEFKTTGTSHSRQAGFYLNNEFNYNNTYIFSFGFRKDYASAVGIEAPSIVYPQVRGAVRLDKLFDMPSAINMFKFRAAYGESGQLPTRADGLPLTWEIITFGEGLGFDINDIGNQKIEPERVKEIEFGFDAELFSIFSVEFTHWRNYAKKSIIDVDFSPSSGYGSYDRPVNLGAVDSWGFESALQINPIRTADYDLNINLIWNYQTSEVKDLGELTTEIPSWMNVTKPGFKKHEFYDEVVKGVIYNEDGSYKTLDVTSEKQALGNPIPDHSGSISVGFRFLKNFNLNIFGEFGFNNKIFSYTIRRMATVGNLADYDYDMLRAQLGIKSMTGVVELTPNTDEYRAAAEKYAKGHPSHYSNYIYDADYFVLREINLSYDFTDIFKTYMTGDIIKSFQAGVSVRNVAKWSKYDLDFEVNYAGGRSTRYGTDMGTLPQARTYNFWFKCGF